MPPLEPRQGRCLFLDAAYNQPTRELAKRYLQQLVVSLRFDRRTKYCEFTAKPALKLNILELNVGTLQD